MKNMTKKQFQLLANDDPVKIELIKQNPELIFHLTKADKRKFSDYHVQNLIRIALKQNPALLKKFTEFGLLVDINLINYVKDIEEANKISSMMSKKELLKNLYEDIEYVNKIPLDALKGSLYNSCVKIIKLHIKQDPKKFEKLPVSLQMKYSLIETYLKANNDNIYKLTNEQLTKNNGKLLFKLIQQNPNNLNKISPKLLKLSLVRMALKLDGALFEDLDDEYKNNEYNRYIAAKNLILTGRKDICNKLFGVSELEYINSKLLRVKTNSAKIIKSMKQKVQNKEDEIDSLNDYFIEELIK